MSDKSLYASVTDTYSTDLVSVTVSENHDGATALATIVTHATALDVGSNIAIDLGYTTSHGSIFNGYVKKVDYSVPDGLITITANDDLVRAVDYFIVGPGPESPYTYRGIWAEDLIAAVLGMSGLNNFNFGTTYFRFGINNDVEVNLVGSHDYCRMICDLIAWNFWCDRTGVIYLRNRKPYPMDGTSGQPGDIADVPIATITDADIISFTSSFNERDLRNKIVVYGGNDVVVSASSPTSYDPLTSSYRQILPVGFYKAAVLASDIIDDESFAQDAADYNLALLNKITYETPITVEGNHILEARKTITLNSSYTTPHDYYIYQLEHVWGQGGFLTNMILRL
jgi:hypothetical protein